MHVCLLAWRVLIALEEKGVPYRSVCVSFSSGVLKSPFFRALNPRMRVPVLVEPVDSLLSSASSSTTDTSAKATDSSNSSNSSSAAPVGSPEVAAIAHGISHLLAMPHARTVVYESTAILEYLERAFPHTPLLPRASLAAFATAQSRMHEANEILSVVGDLVVYLRRFPLDKRSASVLAAKWTSLEAELALWESYFDAHRVFLVDAETPYVCDYTLFTNIAYAVRCGLQLDGLYPRLAAFYSRLCARASIDKTWPPHWRTTPGATVLTKCFYCQDKHACECSNSSNAAAPVSGSSTHSESSPPQSQS